MAAKQSLPPQAVPLVDPETGVISWPWYQFFLALWQNLGQGPGVNAGVALALDAAIAGWTQGVSNPPTQAEVEGVVAQVQVLSQRAAGSI